MLACQLMKTVCGMVFLHASKYQVYKLMQHYKDATPQELGTATWAYAEVTFWDTNDFFFFLLRTMTRISLHMQDLFLRYEALHEFAKLAWEFSLCHSNVVTLLTSTKRLMQIK